MAARDLIDSVRRTFVDASTSPTREIVYTRNSDDIPTTLNSFVGGGVFNKEEKETLEKHQAFAGLKLVQDPKVNDRVLYDGVIFKVKRWTKLGELWTVYGERGRHNGRPNGS